MLISEAENAAMNEESDFPPNKCGRRVDGGVDRISYLPDDVIIHILSFLRLKQAAATSVLSSRWSHLWKHTPNLNVDKHIVGDYDSGYDTDDVIWDPLRCKFIDIVNSVIQSHKALYLKIFRLYVPVSIAKCTVTKWLEFVFSRQVESLELSLYRDEEDRFVLGELVRDSRVCLQPQTDLIFFRSLKTLCLEWLKVSGEDIELFLHNCPLLVHLTINHVTLTSDVEVCGEKLLLKHLDFSFCSSEKSIKVSAPNLTSMKFVERGGKLFENVPKLVEADFDIFSPDFVLEHFAPSASCYFPQLQILFVNLFKVEWLCKLQVLLANGFTRMPNLTKLAIFCHQTYARSLLPITALIWAHPFLEEFKLTCFDIGGEQTACMQVITDVGRSPHQHLKVFELGMAGRQNQNVGKHIAELVLYISDNCVALRKIVIDHWSGPDGPAQRDLITQRLQGKIPSHIQLELMWLSSKSR